MKQKMKTFVWYFSEGSKFSHMLLHQKELDLP